MTRLEMVEKIREKTGVTYDEAREALEKANWDMLDAIVNVEHIIGADGAAYQAAPEPEKIQYETVTETAPVPKKRVVKHYNHGELGNKIAAALKFIGTWIKKGEESHFEVIRKDEVVMSLSLTSLILVFLLSWFIPTVLIVAGLFTGYRFRFVGNSLIGKAASAAVNKAGDKADEIFTRMQDDEDK